ncbi:MAG: HNH endonuclease [Oligoflexia bacterium]|nr:HNH endonuclease [Oligoflexia bacterium]
MSADDQNVSFIRIPISKSLRFEVFKRDSFKCVYCGTEAPGVVLHVDHIIPVAKGGTNEITNLVTACQPCNSGKRDKTLDDNTAVAKARTQMEELQERREQLEMMMQWKEGLRDLTADTVEQLAGYWAKLAPGYILNEAGQADLRKLLRKFSLNEITDAMDTSADQYLRFDDKGNATSESWNHAWHKVEGILKVGQACKDDPGLRELYYIRGIMRKRFFGKSVDMYGMKLLREAREAGVSLTDMREQAKCLPNWTAFREWIEEEIEFRQGWQAADTAEAELDSSRERRP